MKKSTADICSESPEPTSLTLSDLRSTDSRGIGAREKLEFVSSDSREKRDDGGKRTITVSPPRLLHPSRVSSSSACPSCVSSALAAVQELAQRVPQLRHLEQLPVQQLQQRAEALAKRLPLPPLAPQLLLQLAEPRLQRLVHGLRVLEAQIIQLRTKNYEQTTVLEV
ncbi:hypothetical protein EYF80_047683 [Liparis tanakae]|uniref:Uncharacterized protein n=1 Tax=Liparis tanakae TaxID=230148 RepID=A0A4Z2FMR2_9TELE|nr:hypothetical protein EYF80_047683 [Liparis tanakae]